MVKMHNMNNTVSTFGYGCLTSGAFLAGLGQYQ